MPTLTKVAAEYCARNFNPAVAMAGKLCIVEVEEIVETGDMIPDHIHLPGIYVHRLVLIQSLTALVVVLHLQNDTHFHLVNL